MVARPLSLRLNDAAVQDAFLHSLDCEAVSECGSVTMRVMRGRDTAARVFMCIDATETGERIDAVLLDKAQAAFLWSRLLAEIGSLKIGHSVVIRGVQFSVREARWIATALSKFLEE